MKKIFAMIFLSAGVLLAAPALERSKIFIQPDGTTFSGTLMGDEYLNWIETEAGEIVVFNKNAKRYESAFVEKTGLEPSGRAYHANDKRQPRSVQNSAQQRQQLKALWLEKRKIRAQYRQAVKN